MTNDKYKVLVLCQRSNCQYNVRTFDGYTYYCDKGNTISLNEEGRCDTFSEKKG